MSNKIPDEVLENISAFPFIIANGTGKNLHDVSSFEYPSLLHKLSLSSTANVDLYRLVIEPSEFDAEFFCNKLNETAGASLSQAKVAAYMTGNKPGEGYVILDGNFLKNTNHKDAFTRISGLMETRNSSFALWNSFTEASKNYEGVTFTSDSIQINFATLFNSIKQNSINLPDNIDYDIDLFGFSTRELREKFFGKHELASDSSQDGTFKFPKESFVDKLNGQKSWIDPFIEYFKAVHEKAQNDLNNCITRTARILRKEYSLDNPKSEYEVIIPYEKLFAGYGIDTSSLSQALRKALSTNTNNACVSFSFSDMSIDLSKINDINEAKAMPATIASIIPPKDKLYELLFTNAPTDIGRQIIGCLPDVNKQNISPENEPKFLSLSFDSNFQAKISLQGYKQIVRTVMSKNSNISPEAFSFGRGNTISNHIYLDIDDPNKIHFSQSIIEALSKKLPNIQEAVEKYLHSEIESGKGTIS